MDSDGWLRILTLVLLTLGAAYCASSETSFAAMNRVRIQNLADNGDKRAKLALRISDNFEKTITTLLIGNNITHIAFASLVTLISTELWGVKSVKYMTILSTVYVFLFSEMIPKSFAKANSEKFALAISRSLYFVMRLLTPVSFLFMYIAKFVTRLFPENDEPEISKEEFLDIMETVEEEGILGEKQELVRSALSFDEKTVGDVFTPIDKVVSINVLSTKEQILETAKSVKFSRLPVYDGEPDNIIGIIHVRDFLKKILREKDSELDINSLLLEAHHTVCGAYISDLLHDMSTKKIHMSMVVDVTEKIIGLITIEDILEELVGEIWDEDDFSDIYHRKLVRSDLSVPPPSGLVM
ncbi:MAG: HlyC/CorC family transporter [Clostridiales bacterium]|jgi:putative hemolysin|nr:HlyC/CorC family transporter [Clostridiales bacterium]